MASPQMYYFSNGRSRSFLVEATIGNIDERSVKLINVGFQTVTVKTQKMKEIL